MICSLSDTKRAAPVTTKCMCRNNLSDFFSVKTLLFKTVRLYAEYCPNTKTRGTLKSLIEEHARLDFSDFLSTLFAIFHVIIEKFNPARLLIYLVNKQAG